MARPSELACTLANLTEGPACFKNYTSHQRHALMVYFMVLELAALGGTDYRLQIGPDGTLADNSACLDTLDQGKKDLALLLIYQQNADDAGATIPDAADLGEAIKCLENRTPGMLKAMALNLTCALGRHSVYPQVDR